MARTVFINSYFLQRFWLALLLLAASRGADAAITVANIREGETIRYPVAFLRGTANGPGELRVLNRDNSRPDGTNSVPVEAGAFKVLVELQPGLNHLELTAGTQRTAFTLTYRPMTTPYRVNVLYVGASDGEMKYPTERDDDPQNVADRLDTALKLMQTFTAERLHDAGFERRTFPLDFQPSGRIVVHTLRFPAKAEELKKFDSNALWQKYYPWTGQQFNEDKNKCLVITLYVGGALGAGHQAMFGAYGLHVWPSSIRDAYRAFTDTTPVNPARVSDDSVGRSVAWGLAATTMGAALHELGHTFGLEHSPDGESIMSRGFDHFNRFFTVVEQPSRLTPSPTAFADTAVAQWEAPYAARLSVNPWFQPDPPTALTARPPQIRYEAKTQTVVITASYGVRVIEFKPPLDRPDSTPRSGQYKLFLNGGPLTLRYSRAEARMLAGSPAGAEIAVTDTQGNTIIVNEATLNGSADGLFDAANDFYAPNNPNGSWSYGLYSADPKPNPLSFQEYKEWVKGTEGVDVRRYPGNVDPNVVHNAVGKTVTQQTITWEPNALTLHPSWQGFFSVVRWKCPREGKYRIEGAFQGADAKPTTTDVHVFYGVNPLFEDFVEGFGAGSAKRFSQTITIKQNETVDFVVGWGRNRTNINDTTALDAKIIFLP